METLSETKRLRIRKFNEDDAAFIFKLLNSPGWLEFIGERNIKTLEDARLYIANGPLFSYLKFGFGPYLIALRDSGEPIGMCSLIKRETLSDPDLGFAVLDEHARRGYATEASLAVMTYAKNVLGISKLSAFTDKHNHFSIGLLKKLGFVSHGGIKMPGDETELDLFYLNL